MKEKAARHFRHLLKAAELGAGPVMLSRRRVHRYRDGAIGVEPDETEAICWYKRAIEQGSVEAAHELQVLYKQQERAARKRRGNRWFSRALSIHRSEVPNWSSGSGNVGLRAARGLGKNEQRLGRANPTYSSLLHRRDRLQRREPLAEQGRRPGHRHDIVEGEPDEDDERSRHRE